MVVLLRGNIEVFKQKILLLMMEMMEMMEVMEAVAVDYLTQLFSRTRHLPYTSEVECTCGEETTTVALVNHHSHPKRRQ
jgi:hypothetical protein